VVKIIKLIQILIILCAATFFGCSSEKISPNAVALGIDYEWTELDRAKSKNPEIKVSGIPEGTIRFHVGLSDLDLKSFDHGGGYVDHDGSGIIRRGAIVGHYYGPDPPPTITHSYEITVKAIDESDVIIGIGKKTRNFPPN